jgi:hypothetical protein
MKKGKNRRNERKKGEAKQSREGEEKKEKKQTQQSRSEQVKMKSEVNKRVYRLVYDHFPTSSFHSFPLSFFPMPYLSFRTSKNSPVELAGNKEEEFKEKILKHGDIAQPELALQWVRAFFLRRSHAIQKQKALQVGDEDTADEWADKEDEALEEEEKMREKYYNSVGKPLVQAENKAEEEKKSSGGNPYGMEVGAQASNQRQVEDEDDFM